MRTRSGAVSVAGSELGNIDGRIEVTESATNAGGGMDLKVNVPHLRVAVPEGSTSSAQSLGMPDNVRIGARSTPVALILDEFPNGPPCRATDEIRAGNSDCALS